MNMDLSGKTILFLGSSVTYGSAANGVSFVEQLAEKCGCSVVKEAVSGTTLVDNGPDSYVARMKTMDTSAKADLFVCQLSTNDATQGKPAGAFDGCMDTSTIAGAMEFIIDYARRTWNCPVAFYTNPRYDSAAYAAMVDLLYECRGKYGVGVIDLWNDDAFNAITDAQRAEYLADPIHPTLKGYREWWLPVFEENIVKMCR